LDHGGGICLRWTIIATLISASRARGASSRWCGPLFLIGYTLTAHAPCNAYDLLLRWTVPPEPDIAGYRVYAGATSRVYGPPLDVGLLATATLNGSVYYIYHNVNLGSPTTYLTVTDYNQAQVESSYSNEKVVNYASVSVPRVDAGPDQTGNVGDVLTLGSPATAGLSYLWEQTAGPPATPFLSTRTSSMTTFSALAAGTYQFALIAYDAQGVAAQAVVNLVINDPTATPAGSPVATYTGTAAPTITPTPATMPTSTATPIPFSPTGTATAAPGQVCTTFATGVCCDSADGTNCRSPEVACSSSAGCSGLAPYTTCAGASADDGQVAKKGSSVYPQTPLSA
jgi:hypothetical protein